VLIYRNFFDSRAIVRVLTARSMAKLSDRAGKFLPSTGVQFAQRTGQTPKASRPGTKNLDGRASVFAEFQ
jgi:hypothetical protein